MKTVLEIGSGLGLIAILLAKMGVGKILATDGDQHIIQRLKSNIEMNFEGDVEMKRRIECISLEWGEECLMMTQDGGEIGVEKLDLIVGADILYLPSLYPKLMESISFLLETCKNQVNSYPKFLLAIQERYPVEETTFRNNLVEKFHFQQILISETYFKEEGCNQDDDSKKILIYLYQYEC